MPDFSTLLLLMLQILVLWGAARGMGLLAHKAGFPVMAGEMAAGILLGPSFFGQGLPEAFTSFFQANTETAELRQSVIKTALLVFLFYAGLETRIQTLKQLSRPAFAISAMGMAVPFAAGAALVFLAPGWWSGYSEVSTFKTALFLGAALSISALPVIARIFIDLKMMHTRDAALVMTAATVNDVLGWIVFSALLLSQQAGTAGHEFLPLAVFWAGILGAGAIKTNEKLMRLLHWAVLYGFAPLYFASIGLRLDFVTHFDLGLTAVVFFTACLAKTGGVYAGARVGGLPQRDSFLIAAAMNARGAMEILLATLALEAGLIDRRLFVALVFMALATTVAAAGVLKAFVLKPEIKVS